MKRLKIAQRLTELRQALAEAERESSKSAAEALGVTKESLIAKYDPLLRTLGQTVSTAQL